MERGQQEKKITIHVIDDNQWEPDETFFVKLSLPEGEEIRAKLGSKTVALVTIINDDGKDYSIEDKNKSPVIFQNLVLLNSKRQFI
jgi:solute carrier family 8 (sodium/calcium exchanger)